MVYLIDTNTDELKQVEVNGKKRPIIRHNQKLIEGSFPVITVTDRKSITYHVCDFISWREFKPRPCDVVLRGNILYDSSIIAHIDKCQQ